MKFIEQFKEQYRNKGNVQYIGLKITGLVVLVAIFIFVIYLIGSETIFASELASNILSHTIL